MPRLVNSTPKLRRHASGQAFVQVGGKAFYLGKYGTKAAQLGYDAFLQRWISAGRPAQMEADEEVRVSQIVLAFWISCKKRLSAGELQPMKSALRVINELYGGELAAGFGPKKLSIVRDAMVQKGWARTSINKHVHRICRMFRFAVQEELVPAAIWHALKAIEGLRKGETTAHETEPVKPVEDHVVAATLAHLSPMVADMVRIQQLLSCRPDELCQLRPVDIERGDDVWIYRPEQHKNKWRGKKRVILIGPRAQALLEPYLVVPPEQFCFSPQECERRRRAVNQALRKTPLEQGNRSGTNVKQAPKRTAGKRYRESSYRRAIQRACEIAFAMPPHLRQIKRDLPAEELSQVRCAASAWRKQNCWSPNQLRHSAGTRIRKAHGAEAAQVVLGHSHLNTTEIYAERDLAKAALIVLELG